MHVMSGFKFVGRIMNFVKNASHIRTDLYLKIIFYIKWKIKKKISHYAFLLMPKSLLVKFIFYSSDDLWFLKITEHHCTSQFISIVIGWAAQKNYQSQKFLYIKYFNQSKKFLYIKYFHQSKKFLYLKYFNQKNISQIKNFHSTSKYFSKKIIFKKTVNAIDNNRYNVIFTKNILSESRTNIQH